MEDLAEVLGPHLEVLRGNLNRPSLTLQTITLPDQAERLAWLAEQLATLQGHGIIYTLTVRDANMVASWLKSRGLRVEAYTGETGDRRPEFEQALLHNQVKALVATSALGMGFDKPDLAFVIHYQMPGSVVAYYQQVGRAGRALESAYGILLSGKEETEITDWFINNAFPSRREVDEVIHALEHESAGLSVPFDEALVREAVAFLRRTNLPIESRLQWPAGGMPQYQVKGKIAVDFQAQTGKALSIWGDAGWGGLVREGKYHDNFYSDALVKACVAMMHTWNPEPAPTWVTCVPSLRHPDLVPDVAKRLAEALNLPFQMVLAKTDHRPEQKTMANSTQQARNIDGSLAVIVPKLPEGAVLLVDDIVDSRWTLTVSAWLLRKYGSGAVLPLTLAQSVPE
ncbi:MAG: helicase-related protein [Chlorobiaceae bacterium]